jgi:hypothetical protein
MVVSDQPDASPDVRKAIRRSFAIIAVSVVVGLAMPYWIVELDGVEVSTKPIPGLVLLLLAPLPLLSIRSPGVRTWLIGVVALDLTALVLFLVRFREPTSSAVLMLGVAAAIVAAVAYCGALAQLADDLETDWGPTWRRAMIAGFVALVAVLTAIGMEGLGGVAQHVHTGFGASLEGGVPLMGGGVLITLLAIPFPVLGLLAAETTLKWAKATPPTERVTLDSERAANPPGA